MQTEKKWYDGLAPQSVFRFFDEIDQIPRGTGNMQAISNAVVGWLRDMGVRAEKDAFCNVKAFKAASPGYESAPSVMLTAHLDMVCAKTDWSKHDFLRDPIEVMLLPDGDTITANGTTLGADDGMGAAMILALFADDTLPHPALEAAFTADEESDMNGAIGMDYSDFCSKLIINLDGDPIGIAGAGEMDTAEELPYRRVKVPAGYAFRKVTLSGLAGGHSGADAAKERGNAVMLLSRALRALGKESDLRLCGICGGNDSSTAFAYYAEADIALPCDAVQRGEELLRALSATYADELALRDPKVKLEWTETKAYDLSADRADTVKLLTFLAALPDGVMSKNLAYPGLMESSVNTGVVRMTEKSFTLLTTIRSAVKSRKYELYDRICCICEAFGADIRVVYDLPQWDKKVSDEVLELCREIYPDCGIVIEEGTNECGVFNERMPEASVISLQCPYFGAHSTEERISASLVREYYDRLTRFIARMK